MRFFGLLATGALLAVGAGAALTIATDARLPTINSSTAQPPAPQELDTPVKKAVKKKQAPAAPKLTAAQREARAAAVVTLRGEGYRPVALSDYAAGKELRVLIGRGDAGQRAFFFAGGKYIGNDTTSDSDRITVVRAGNSSVSLSYKIAGGKPERVLFRWDGKHLAPQTAIPPATARNAP
jgi:LppP/LprE lipoprotein